MTQPAIVFCTDDPKLRASFASFPEAVPTYTIEEAERIESAPPAVLFRAGFATEIGTPNLQRCFLLESRWKAAGCLIFNGVGATVFCQRKDLYYPALELAGVPVPEVMPGPSASILDALDYFGGGRQVILRAPDRWGGDGLHVVRNSEELRKTRALFGRIHADPMLVRYVETRRRDGLYQKIRAYAIGGRLDMAAWIQGANPSVRWASPHFAAETLKANMTEPIPDDVAGIVESACRVLAIDVAAMDLVMDYETSELFLTDVNPIYHYAPPLRIFPAFEQGRRREHNRRIGQWLIGMAGGTPRTSG